jgi:hypothetical protein
MTRSRRSALTFVVIVSGGLATAAPATAQPWDRSEAPGRLVGVSVEVEGRAAPLYAARDGSARLYLEAREGARYAITVTNRTGERLGAAVVVDGLNAISGQRESAPGRMYILGPWEETTVRGWRTSLSAVQRFTFVDERASYAARSGKANGKMGWIEVNVYRERRPFVSRPWLRDWAGRPDPVAPRPREEATRSADGPSPAAAAPDAAPADPDGRGDPAGKAAPGLEAQRRYAPPADREADGRSYPGTGWGPRADDPAVVVDFNPEPTPADCVTLRYEYAGALRALGVLPRPGWGRDRLRERDRGQDGFAAPPAW